MSSCNFCEKDYDRLSCCLHIRRLYLVDLQQTLLLGPLLLARPEISDSVFKQDEHGP